MRDAGVDLPPEPGLPGAADPYPPVLTISMAKVDTLRYGENPHQPAARYRRTDREPRAAEGPFASGEPPLQGKALSYNNVLDASAAAVARPAAARARRRHRQAHQPVRRGRARDAPRGLGRGPRRRPGLGVRRRRRRHGHGRPRRSPSGWPRSSSRSSSRRRFDDGAREVLATKPNLRLVVDASLDASADRAGLTGRGLLDVDWLGSLRTAGGAVLVTAPDTQPDDPAAWATVSRRPPTGEELRDLDLAWRLCRGVVSNAIVLVRDGMLVGLGSGQVSRVDACRQAVEKAAMFQGERAAKGAVAASDAFFPFADGPGLLLDAGVTAIVQPGGSVRDAEVLAAVDAAGAAMLVTGTRHFRH